MAPKEIHKDIVQILHEDTFSYADMKKEAVEFKRDRNSIENESWSGYPKTSTASKQIDAIHCMVLDDRHFTV